MSLMSWIRGFAGVIVGYAVAAGANMAWVMYWYVNRSDASGWLLVISTIVFFALSGTIAGWIAGAIAKPVRSTAGLTLGVVLAGVAALNLWMGAAIEPTWHTVLALLIQAPAATHGARYGRTKVEVGRPPR